MARNVKQEEILKALKQYLYQSQPFIDRLVEIRKRLTPKVIVDKEKGKVEILYEETDESIMIKKNLNDLRIQIKEDVENGKFL